MWFLDFSVILTDMIFFPFVLHMLCICRWSGFITIFLRVHHIFLILFSFISFVLWNLLDFVLFFFFYLQIFYTVKHFLSLTLSSPIHMYRYMLSTLAIKNVSIDCYLRHCFFFLLSFTLISRSVAFRDSHFMHKSPRKVSELNVTVFQSHSALNCDRMSASICFHFCVSF